MLIYSKFFCFLLIICAFVILIYMKKSGRFFSCIFLSLIQGVSSLFAVNLITSVTGVSVAINWISIAISSIGGVFGVVAILIADVLLMA